VRLGAQRQERASEHRTEWLSNPTVEKHGVPDFDPELALKTAARVPVTITGQWLKAHSPIPVTCSTGEFLGSLFEPDKQVLIFNKYESQGCLVWHRGVQLKSLVGQHWRDGAWFLSNAVDGQYHWNPRQQKQSRRSEESVTSFRYAVLECDQKPEEQWHPIWFRILVQQRLPTVSIVHSGHKSAHALVRVSQANKQSWDAFKRALLRPLVPLGADDGALTAVRLTRLPGSYRGDQRQELLYLDPAAAGRPIYERFSK
jgi:hypothetical protein